MARVRSPNYPAISLPEAIKLVSSIQVAEQHLAAPKEVVAKHIGYTTYHGLAKRVISALENYGLLEETTGDKVKVSSLAMSILFPAAPEEKQKALNDAASKHALFAAIKEEWQGSRPSDENLRVYLIRRKFAADALDRVIEVYKETMDLVTQESVVYPAPEVGQSAKKQEEPAMQTTAHRPPVTPAPVVGPSGGDPYRVSLTPGGLQGVFDLKNINDADDLIRAISAWKMLLKPASEMKKPAENPWATKDEAAN